MTETVTDKVQICQRRLKLSLSLYHTHLPQNPIHNKDYLGLIIFIRVSQFRRQNFWRHHFSDAKPIDALEFTSFIVMFAPHLLW